MGTSPSATESVDHAVAAAIQASTTRFSDTANVLRQLAQGIRDNSERLIEVAHDETGLSARRLSAEAERTAIQFESYSSYVDSGAIRDVVADVIEKPDGSTTSLLRLNVPLGPVAVFEAGNFPLAFGTLGTDTGAALASGCPVIVKAHPAHRQTSRVQAELAHQVFASLDLPSAWLTLLGDDIHNDLEDHAMSRSIVSHDGIEAVAFTGSFRGGKAILDIASERSRPIPVFAEMSSVNPVVISPGAAADNADVIAAGFAGSLTQDAGQYCTSPGVLLLPASSEGRSLAAEITRILATSPRTRMISDRYALAYSHTLDRWASQPSSRAVQDGSHVMDDLTPNPTLMEVPASELGRDGPFAEECFGPACLLSYYRSQAELMGVMQKLAGCLVVCIHSKHSEEEFRRKLVVAASQVAGRIVLDGYPTGVEISTAQVHGGPYPSTSAPSYTSVGPRAALRFVRPIALQGATPNQTTEAAGMIMESDFNDIA